MKLKKTKDTTCYIIGKKKNVAKGTKLLKIKEQSVLHAWPA